MGQKMTTNKYKLPPGEEGNDSMIHLYDYLVSRNRFEFVNIIGKGGFGKVWKVIDKKQNIQYALKEMTKLKVIDKKSEKSIKYERELLSHLKHPFIVNMYYAFQDYDNLYLVMDLLTGGDLRYHVCRHRKFTEEQTRFFIACIILGLEYIHSKNVLHRDIKPENLVLDDSGYVRITDFGIAKVFSHRNSSETSGTPGYMSPEVMKGQNHTAAVDYFALGVIGYEFMLGHRPYVGKTRKEIKEQMMIKQAQIKLSEVPDGWSEEAVDFINKLLQRKAEIRLGFKGAYELKNHPWLKYFPWKEIHDKTYIAPFVPEKRDNYDKKYCNTIDKIGMDTKSRYEQYRISQNFKCVFENFTYYPILDTSDSFEGNANVSGNQSPKRKISATKKNPSLQNSKSRPNLIQIDHIRRQRSSVTSKLNSCTSNSIDHNYNSHNVIHYSPSSASKNRHHMNSKSTINFRNYPIKRTINLSQVKQLSSNTIMLSNNTNKTITTNKNMTTTKINPKPKFKTKGNIKTLEDDIINRKTFSYKNQLNKRGKSVSNVLKQIRSSSTKNEKSRSTVVKTTFHRSISNYGKICSSKPKQDCSSINIKVIEMSRGSSKQVVSNSSKPSSENTKITPHHTKHKSTNSNTVNILFKNYKISTNSSNSTGSSSVSNNNKKPKL